MKRRRSKRLFYIGTGILAVLAVVYVSANRSKNTGTAPVAQVNVDPETLPGIQTGPDPWPSEIIHLRERLKMIGLPALLEEGSALHSHQHLDVYIHGNAVLVPSYIGINAVERFISPLHTHDMSGEIHIEAPSVQTYTLGQFFDIWGVRFTAKCIGGFCADDQNAIQIFVNGQPATGDPRSIGLTDHEEIAVTFGTPEELPKPIPSEHNFSPGA
jgi:hypothetical protein